jgi:hypothetical protein
MENLQSFTARRSAASNLPTFQLPPPDLGHKYPQYAPSNNPSQSAPQPVQNILTPPVGLSNDGLSPLSSGVNSGSSQSSTNGVPPYNPVGYWPNQNPGYPLSSAPSMPSPFAQNQNSMYMNRPQLFSPSSINYQQQRSVTSPTSGDGLPPPPYDSILPPFPSNGGAGGQTSLSTNLPALQPGQQAQQQAQQQHNEQNQARRQQEIQQIQQQQHHHQQQQQQQQQQAQQQQMVNASFASQQSSSGPPQQSNIHAPDNYGPRPPPTPTYSFGSSSTPQQSTFPAYTQPSPTQQSPVTSGAPQNRISPISTNHPAMHPPPSNLFNSGRPYNGYALPAMAGPIMSNVHNPGNQMALVGGMTMQGYPHPAMGPHHYGHPGSQAANDRPFKCDQCPQSFNRNHDLKRHKRIHLAVKPFPCNHCDKSFSRKDALKVRTAITKLQCVY